MGKRVGSSTMKIEDIETTVVTVPFNAPVRWSKGVVTGTTRTVIKVISDDETIGIGETEGASPKNVIDTQIKPILVGSSPFDIEKLLAQCSLYDRYQPFFTRNMRAFAGIEIALWDMIGKAVDKPVYDLIGGLFRDKVPFSGYWYPRYESSQVASESTPEAIAKFCEETIRAYGFTRLEGKVGIFPPNFDVKTIEAIRSAVGPEIELGVDPNAAWSPETAIKVIKKMNAYDLCNVEEPCRELEACARVRSRIDVPVSTHCPLIAEVVRLGVADIMVSDPYEIGGILVTKKLVGAAELHNLGFWLHSAAELGVSLAANIHIAASSPHMIHPNQGTYEHIADDIIKGGKHRIKDGCISVPNGPGLGVQLDEAKLKQYHELYLAQGAAGFGGHSTISSNADKQLRWPSLPQY